ncbi:hypothetical protein PTKIN_Ptkin09bG0195900 [Pterospermum kingtungense]
MAATHFFSLLLLLFFCFVFPSPCSATTRKLSALVQQQSLLLKYHNGPLLKGNITVNLVWYGKFSSTQRSIIVDFLNSLSSAKTRTSSPSVSSWWQTTGKYRGGSSSVVVGKQFLHNEYSLGKALKTSQLKALSSKAGCGTHGSGRVKKSRFAYAWVGNSVNQCPGYCAWPFHQPVYGPQTPPLVAPNGDVGVDGMVINLATVLDGTVTNPFNNE